MASSGDFSPVMRPRKPEKDTGRATQRTHRIQKSQPLYRFTPRNSPVAGFCFLKFSHMLPDDRGGRCTASVCITVPQTATNAVGAVYSRLYGVWAGLAFIGGREETSPTGKSRSTPHESGISCFSNSRPLCWERVGAMLPCLGVITHISRAALLSPLRLCSFTKRPGSRARGRQSALSKTTSGTSWPCFRGSRQANAP